MDKHIVIVGAGASGIAAGTRLMAAGYSNVTVLEAEQRIGGRVNTIPYGNATIDIGAQWCHGEKDNVVYQLAKDHDLLESGILTQNGMDFVQSDGTKLSKEQKDQMMQLMDLLELSDADAAEASNAGRSLGDLVIERYAVAMQTDEYKNIDAEVAAQFLQTMHRYNNGMMASDSWFEMSLGGYTEYRESEGNQLLTWKGAGYRKVFDLLLREIPDPSQTIPLMSRIQFGRTVCNIDWSSESARRRVECTDGTAIEADHVIVTVSLGVLQKHHTKLFTPALPVAKVNAIEAHKLGTVAKIYLEFEKPFWANGEWSGFTTLWRQQELDAMRANPSDEWLTSVSGVYKVDYQPNMLCGWVSGESARKMAELPEEQVMDSMMRVVRMFMPDRVVTDPISIKRSQWNLETNFLGSYSYQTVRANELQASRADLAAPLVHQTSDASNGRPVVQFAGEATIATRYGTVDGAIQSGWREADRLIELYK